MSKELKIEEGQSPLINTKSLVFRADDLAREHDEFNDMYIVAGRKALYELLGKIYALSEELESCIDKEDQVGLLRRVLYEKYGIRTQENTSNTTVLVRYITNADRKTAHVYSRAIEVARMNNIGSSKFSGYIEEAGGLERIRADAATPVLTSKNLDAIQGDMDVKQELARKYLRARSELPLATFKLGKRYLQEPKTNAFKQFVCYERNGRYYVLAQQDVDDDQELKLVESITKILDPNLQHAAKRVNVFYSKAMLKRKQRIIKEISKRRPEVGASIRTNVNLNSRSK